MSSDIHECRGWSRTRLYLQTHRTFSLAPNLILFKINTIRFKVKVIPTITDLMIVVPEVKIMVPEEMFNVIEG